MRELEVSDRIESDSDDDFEGYLDEEEAVYGGRFEEICREDDWQQEGGEEVQHDGMEYEGVQDMEVEHERMGCEGVQDMEVEHERMGCEGVQDM